MKRIMASLIVFIYALGLNAQVMNKLVGSHWNGNVEMFTSLDISTKTFTNIDTLNSVQSLAQGESTFDAINNRYFNQTNLGITIINAQTGAIIDTIVNSIGMRGIEYNINSGKLLGSHWNGNVEMFTSLDISTKTFTDIDTLNGVQSIAQGFSTFDATNNRYFNQTNLGITIINAQTGAIIDTIANSIGMLGIEYDLNSGKLLGSHWNGNIEMFTSLDISTKTFTDIDTLNGVQSLAQGESTFDATNNRYFNQTNLGITIINAQTGAIIDTVANSIGMKGIEYSDISSTNGIASLIYEKNLAIFPNPFNSVTTIQFPNIIKNAELSIYDIYGQKIKAINQISGEKVVITRDYLQSGDYFIILTQGGKIISTNKLVITD